MREFGSTGTCTKAARFRYCTEQRAPATHRVVLASCQLSTTSGRDIIRPAVPVRGAGLGDHQTFAGAGAEDPRDLPPAQSMLYQRIDCARRGSS